MEICQDFFNSISSIFVWKQSCLSFYHMWLYLWTEYYLVLHGFILYFPTCFFLSPFHPWDASILMCEGMTFLCPVLIVLWRMNWKEKKQEEEWGAQNHLIKAPSTASTALLPLCLDLLQKMWLAVYPCSVARRIYSAFEILAVQNVYCSNIVGFFAQKAQGGKKAKMNKQKSSKKKKIKNER